MYRERMTKKNRYEEAVVIGYEEISISDEILKQIESNFGTLADNPEERRIAEEEAIRLSGFTGPDKIKVRFKSSKIIVFQNGIIDNVRH